MLLRVLRTAITLCMIDSKYGTSPYQYNKHAYCRTLFSHHKLLKGIKKNYNYKVNTVYSPLPPESPITQAMQMKQQLNPKKNKKLREYMMTRTLKEKR